MNSNAQPKPYIVAERVCKSFGTHQVLKDVSTVFHTGEVTVIIGASGSGKSHAARALAATGDWIRIRSDVERKRLRGLAPSSRAGVHGAMYAAAAREAVAFPSRPTDATVTPRPCRLEFDQVRASRALPRSPRGRMSNSLRRCPKVLFR